MNTRVSIFALALFLLLLQACDLFKDDTPKTKSTEFSFTVDTLHGIGGSFEQIHIFNDTSFVIVGSFYDESVVPNFRFNQIWWGKKKGIYYKSGLTQSHFDLTKGNLRFFNGTYENHIYGGSNSITIYKNGNYTYNLVSRNIENPLIFTNSTFINDDDFYVFGKNGVLGLYKNGEFHRIETNTDLDFTHGIWHGDSLLLYGIQVYDTFKSEQAGLFVVKDTVATAIDRWGYEQENKKPFYPNTLLWEDGTYYFFGQEGIYSYLNQRYKLEEFLLMGYGQFATRNEGVFQVLDSRLFYFFNGEIIEQEISFKTDNVYITKMAFKNDLWVIEANNYYLIIGFRK